MKKQIEHILTHYLQERAAVFFLITASSWLAVASTAKCTGGSMIWRPLRVS